jgi:hypothetical protein
MTRIETVLNQPFVESKRDDDHPVLLGDKEESSSLTLAKKAKMLTLDAPKLNKLPPVTSGYINELATYMMAILLESIKSNLNQSDVLKLQNSMANLFTKMAELNLQKAQDTAEKLQNESPLIKILSGVAAALMMLGGILTANPSLVIGALILVVMTDTPAGSELNKALSHLPTGLKILAEAGIALALAVVSCGASGMISAGTTAAETVAETGAEEAGVDAAADGAEGAAADSTDGAAQTTENSEGFWSRAGKLGFKSAGHVAATTVAQGMSVGLTPDLVRQLLKAIGVSDEKALSLVSTIMGALISLGAGIGTSVANAAEGTTAANIGAAVQGIRIVGGVMQGGTGIYSGVNQIKASEIMQKKADIDSAQAVCSSLSTLTNGMIKQDNQAAKALFDVYAAMNSRWGAYNEPGLAAARDLAG